MDPEEIVEQVKKGVRAELADVKAQVAQELQDQFDGETAERFTQLETTLATLQADLQQRQAAGDRPGAQAVQDMERRMDEAEAKQKELQEQLRLSQARQALPAGAVAPTDFGGVFVRESEDLRQYLRSYWMMDHAKEAHFRSLGTGLFSGGGQLPATAADAFIDFVIAQQATLSRIVTLRMNAPTGYTDELRVGARKMIAATEATAPSVADAITMHRRTLTSVEVIWAEDITLTLLEDAIERAGTEGHIAQLIATGFGNDSNDLAWNGDDSDSDPFIGINDGFLALFTADAEVNDVDFSASPVPTTCTAVLQALLQNMPTKFLGRTDHVVFSSVAFAQKYAEEVSTRETGLGDQVLVGGFPALRYFGIPIVPDTHLASATQRIVLTPTANLTFGIQRVLRVDSEWVPRKRIVEYTLSARTDYQHVTGEAVVNGTSVPTALN